MEAEWESEEEREGERDREREKELLVVEVWFSEKIRDQRGEIDSLIWRTKYRVQLCAGLCPNPRPVYFTLKDYK